MTTMSDSIIVFIFMVINTCASHVNQCNRYTKRNWQKQWFLVDGRWREVIIFSITEQTPCRWVLDVLTTVPDPIMDGKPGVAFTVHPVDWWLIRKDRWSTTLVIIIINILWLPRLLHLSVAIEIWLRIIKMP
jgi:hypothetical protein